MASDRVVERKELIRLFSESPSGLEWCRQHTRLCDEIVREIAGGNERLYAIIATGGYGREELAPYSDIDITIVPIDEADVLVDDAIRQLYRSLHATFTQIGLEVGYSYRLIADAPGLDAISRTGLMDMRLIAGPYHLFQSLQRELEQSLAPGEFIVEKIRERQTAFVKYNDTPLVGEPHLKEGAGGVRCLQTANWIRACIGERSAKPTEAYDRILAVRNALHLVSEKRQDSLTRGRQEPTAAMLGLTGSELISQVSADGLVLNGEYERTLERLHEARFSLASGVLAIRGEVRLDGDVDAGEAAVGIATATRLGLRVPDVQMVTVGPVKGPAAAFALATGEATIRNLDRAGLLNELLPELTTCRTLAPESSMHTWTVFEHTMRMVRHLESLQPGNFLGDVRSAIAGSETLYLAALLHDVGKRISDENHARLGEAMSRDICKRWGLGEDVTESVAWLIREHLTMARFIRMRDLMRPETIDEFAAIVGDIDRLAMLTVLTWADVNSVAEGSWTAAQDTFLRQLYHQTAARFHDDWQGPDPNQYRRRLLRQLSGNKSDASFQEFLESLPASYLLATAPENIRLDHHYVMQAREDTPTVDFYARPELGASDVTVAAVDRAGLLSDLLGVFYAYDLSVQAIRAATASGEQPVALDVLTLSFGGRPVPSATAIDAQRSALEVLRGERTASDVLRERGKDPDRPQSIFTYIYIPGHPGVLEIRAPRGRGMAFRFSRLIAQQGWNVTAARVGQWAGNAAAAFYIVGADGRTVESDEIDQALATI